MSTCTLIEGSEPLIKGTLRKGNVFLLSAPPGSGKTSFCLDFLYQGLKDAQPAIALVTDCSPSDMLSMASSLGLNLEQYVEAGSLRIIDCYSWRLGEKITAPYFVEPKSLSDVSIGIEKSRFGLRNGRFTFDSVSSLILGSSTSTAISFLSTLSARLKRDGFDCIFVLEGGADDEKTVAMLRYITDGVLEMKTDESTGKIERFFRIYSLRGVYHQTCWVHFMISDRGFVLEIGSDRL